MEETYYIGETGRTLSQTTGFDWTGSTAKQVLIQKPSGEVDTFSDASVVVDDAETGQIHIVSLSDTFDETGEHFFQAKCTISTVIKYGPLMSFFVEEVLTAS